MGDKKNLWTLFDIFIYILDLEISDTDNEEICRGQSKMHQNVQREKQGEEFFLKDKTPLLDDDMVNITNEWNSLFKLILSNDTGCDY